ncbi:DUF2586 domain-containing protein [Dielma fastidiosa]|uniref:DUF2586 family protein n=1 Tax=Dielma fastidiosa TaxID=1034346 RepID=A0AB35UKL4_9FIRM|nr:DUF2586 domain-containing protein [Dielma fastidiosa]MDY5168603.1 DUF2586 family protein [Dielma fastidiosa]
MLRDVNVTVTDKLLGAGVIAGEGTHLKIGASPIASDVPIVIRSSYSMEKIKKLIGYSPLADSVLDSIENGSDIILCLPVKASTSGTIGEVTKTCAAALTVSGSPTNTFDIKVRITAGGGLNTAAYIYTINGGFSWSETATMPVDGIIDLTETCGIKLTFTTPESTVFAVDDEFSFNTTAPTMSNADVLAALDKIKTINQEFEFVHVVGECDGALATAVSVKQQQLLAEKHKPLMILLEAIKPTADQSAEDYAEALMEEYKNIKNYDIQVCVARGNYSKSDGTVREQNLASIVAGLYSKSKVQQSIGQVDTFNISSDKLGQLTPLGIEEYIEELDEARLLTLRSYDGLTGFYVTNARMLSPTDSDYIYAEDVRVKNKIIREIRKSALQQMQSEVDMESDQTIIRDLTIKKEFIQQPLDEMKENKEISDFAVELINPVENMKVGNLSLKVRYKAKGIVREINIDLGRAG